MRKTVLLTLLLAGCSHTVSPVRTIPVIVKTPIAHTKTVYKKCNLPDQPSPLTKPLPMDNPQKLINRLTDKLSEWAGPGGYGDKVEKACK